MVKFSKFPPIYMWKTFMEQYQAWRESFSDFWQYNCSLWHIKWRQWQLNCPANQYLLLLSLSQAKYNAGSNEIGGTFLQTESLVRDQMRIHCIVGK